MKIKIANLSGAKLDWAVAKCEGRTIVGFLGGAVWVKGRTENGYELAGCDFVYAPRADWVLSGPIIEREGIESQLGMRRDEGEFHAWWFCKGINGNHQNEHSSLLIAAMRCYVSSKLGDEVEIPKELW